FLAVIPGLLASATILLVRERPVAVTATHTHHVSLREFPATYWKYLAVTALFGIGASSSNSFIIMETRSIGASFGTTILVYAGFNLMAALVSYPAGSVSDTSGRRNVLLAGFVIAAVAYVGFARTTNVALMGGLFLAYG